jgi:hypothetical protein
MKKKTIETYRPLNIMGFGNTNDISLPAAYVGNFLPKLEHGYVEIVRLCLRSTTGDIVSIRAKKLTKGYRIMIVDEYHMEFENFIDFYRAIPTQGEIFEIIALMTPKGEEYSYLDYLVIHNEFYKVEHMAHFVYIDSNLYPNLNDMYLDFLNEHMAERMLIFSRLFNFSFYRG